MYGYCMHARRKHHEFSPIQSERNAGGSGDHARLDGGSSVEAAITAQGSQAITSAFAGFANWAVANAKSAAAAIGMTANVVMHAGSANLNALDITTTTAKPSNVTVIQTNADNFRIHTHLVSASNSYVYVTPGGNYTFSKSAPSYMKLVWLDGNVSVPLASFGVMQGGSLEHGTSVVKATKTLYDVNTTELSTATVVPKTMGYLNVLYNFTTTPLTVVSTYKTTSNVDYNVEWTVVGGNYVTRSNDTRPNQNIVSAVAVNKTLGQLPYVTLAHSQTKDPYLVEMDVSDAGTANFVYGKMKLDGQTYNAVTAVFAQNIATIDPSLGQSNDCQVNNVQGTMNLGCSFTSNVTSGDVLLAEFQISAAGTGGLSISDSQGNTWSQGVSLISSSYGLGNVIWYSTASSSASDTVTVRNTTDWGIAEDGLGIYQAFSYIYEISGMLGTIVENSGTGFGTCNSSCNGATFGVSSANSFSKYDFATAIGWTDTEISTTVVESGYTMNQYGGGPYRTASIYSMSGVSSPTSYKLKFYDPGGYSADWSDAGLLFLTTEQPVKATAASGVSTGTVSVSGCSVSPSNFSGDGTVHDLTSSASCSLTLTAPSGDVWSGTGTTTTVTTCSSGTCSEDDLTYTSVTQPITATLSGSGSTQTISVSGCNASPTTLSGDGSSHNIAAAPSCALTLTTPSGYQWQGDGTTETVNTCSSGTCSTSSWNYVETVTLPVSASRNETGTTQTITVTGCGTNMSGFSGDNSTYDLTVDASCNVTLALPNGFVWLVNSSSTTSNVITDSTCPTGSCSLFGIYYAAANPQLVGYMTGSNFNVHAVQTTVSFQGMAQSDVPASDTLGAGMWVAVNSHVANLDYGYSVLAVVPHTGSMFLEGQVVRICEGYGSSACGLASQKVIESWTYAPTMSTSDSIMLEMRFSGSVLTWYYEIDSGSNSSITSFTVPSNSQTAFEVGTTTSELGRVPKFFQFGVEANVNIGNTGWTVLLSNIEYQINSTVAWTTVNHANVAQGTNTWLDYRSVWGGMTFTDTTACYYDSGTCSRATDSVLFESASSTLSDGTNLW